jgi:hypothetical protein
VLQVYRELEQDKNLDYWKEITVIVEDELRKLHKLENQSVYKAGTVLLHFSCGTLVCVCSYVQIFIIILQSLFIYLLTHSLTHSLAVWSSKNLCLLYD